MASPSTTAGKACAECDIPDPCILDVATDFPGNKENHHWSKEGRVHFDLLDYGEGQKGTSQSPASAIIRTNIKPGWKKEQEIQRLRCRLMALRIMLR